MTSTSVVPHQMLSARAPASVVASVEAIFAAHGDQVAAVIVEPVAANMGTVPPAADFLTAMGRTNDAILFGGQVQLFVETGDAEAEALAASLPSSASRDYGRPFAEVFKALSNANRLKIFQRLASCCKPDTIGVIDEEDGDEDA